MLIKLCKRIDSKKLIIRQFSVFNVSAKQKNPNLNQCDLDKTNLKQSPAEKCKDLKDKEIPIKESSINKYFRSSIKKFDGRLN
jgi:hypothetical protein